MRKAAKILGWVVAGYVSLALALDAFIGVTKIALEPGEREGILRTFDADGTMHETRMIVIDDGDVIWVQSGHHFRGWYYRLIDNPNVELLRGGTLTLRQAVALETPEAKAHMRTLLMDRVGFAGYYAIRFVLLFADVKPVRLDMRSTGMQPGAEPLAGKTATPIQERWLRGLFASRHAASDTGPVGLSLPRSCWRHLPM
ncbi:MAG: hypothetical protein OXG51_03540 [Gammaproteobacteria bacterium]|nr:hypothetical protein [Gammaproteobacteria bacterium]